MPVGIHIWEYQRDSREKKERLKIFLNIKDGEHMLNFRERLKFTFQTA
jgi:hypothetical protein